MSVAAWYLGRSKFPAYASYVALAMAAVLAFRWVQWNIPGGATHLELIEAARTDIIQWGLLVWFWQFAHRVLRCLPGVNQPETCGLLLIAEQSFRRVFASRFLAFFVEYLCILLTFLPVLVILQAPLGKSSLSYLIGMEMGALALTSALLFRWYLACYPERLIRIGLLVVGCACAVLYFPTFFVGPTHHVLWLAGVGTCTSAFVLTTPHTPPQKHHARRFGPAMRANSLRHVVGFGLSPFPRVLIHRYADTAIAALLGGLLIAWKPWVGCLFLFLAPIAAGGYSYQVVAASILDDLALTGYALRDITRAITAASLVRGAVYIVIGAIGAAYWVYDEFSAVLSLPWTVAFLIAGSAVYVSTLLLAIRHGIYREGFLVPSSGYAFAVPGMTFVLAALILAASGILLPTWFENGAIPLLILVATTAAHIAIARNALRTFPEHLHKTYFQTGQWLTSTEYKNTPRTAESTQA